MKKIEIDDELYQYIASNTQSIGESASDILRRLLNLSQLNGQSAAQETDSSDVSEPSEQFTKEQQAQVEAEEENRKASQASVFDILNKEELAMQKGVVGRFLFILAALHRTHKKSFDNVLNIKGRDRRYFGKSKEELVSSGSSLNPKQIDDSPYWVMTNSNTTRKKLMLHEVAIELGYNKEDAETIRDYL